MHQGKGYIFYNPFVFKSRPCILDHSHQCCRLLMNMAMDVMYSANLCLLSGATYHQCLKEIKEVNCFTSTLEELFFLHDSPLPSRPTQDHFRVTGYTITNIYIRTGYELESYVSLSIS